MIVNVTGTLMPVSAVDGDTASATPSLALTVTCTVVVVCAASRIVRVTSVEISGAKAGVMVNRPSSPTELVTGISDGRLEVSE